MESRCHKFFPEPIFIIIMPTYIKFVIHDNIKSKYSPAILKQIFLLHKNSIYKMIPQPPLFHNVNTITWQILTNYCHFYLTWN